MWMLWISSQLKLRFWGFWGFPKRTPHLAPELRSASSSLVFDSPNRGGPVRPPFGTSPAKNPTKGCAPSPYRAIVVWYIMIYPLKSVDNKNTQKTHTSGSQVHVNGYGIFMIPSFSKKSRVNYYLQKKWSAEEETNKFQTLCPFNDDFMNLMVNSMLCYKGSKLSNLLATGPPCRFNKKRHHHCFFAARTSGPGKNTQEKRQRFWLSMFDCFSW